MLTDPTQLTFAFSVLGVIVGMVIPVVTAVVTQKMSSNGLKALVMLALSAAGGFFGAWQVAGDAYSWRSGLVSWLLLFGYNVAAHYGFLGTNGFGLTGDAGLIQSKIGTFGLGGPGRGRISPTAVARPARVSRPRA